MSVWALDRLYFFDPYLYAFVDPNQRPIDLEQLNIFERLSSLERHCNIYLLFLDFGL